jgi:hypothetical protein
LVLVLVLIGIAFLTSAYVFRERSQRLTLERGVQSMQQLLRLQLDEDRALMRATVDMMSINPDLRRAINDGDRQALEHQFRPVFDRLREQRPISHLYVSLANRHSLIKLEGPGRGGQVVKRLAMFDEAEGGGDSSGLDLGALGILTLRTVVPWRDQHGDLIGFVELGEDVAPMVDVIRRVLNLDVLVLIHKDRLDRDKWEEGERLTGGQTSWDELSSSVAVAHTLQSIPTALGLLLEDGSRPRKAVIATENGRRVLLIASRPLLAVDQQEIGEIVVLRDVTSSEIAFRWALAGTIGFTLLIAAALILHTRRVLTRLTRPQPPAGEGGEGGEAESG